MILIAMGANLASPRHWTPRETLEAALKALEERGLKMLLRSSWYRSAPVPRSDQPWFVNGVIALETKLGPGELLQLLHDVEADFGRVRSVPNAPRCIDLDLLAYNDLVSEEGAWPVLPHPRLAERAFVVRPLEEIAPEWRHPVTGLDPSEMALALPEDQLTERMDCDPVGDKI